METLKWFGLSLIIVSMMIFAFRFIMPTGNESIWRILCGWTVVWTAIDIGVIRARYNIFKV